jgi:hypothetical protein
MKKARRNCFCMHCGYGELSPYLPCPHGAKEAAVVSVLLVELDADIDELKEWKQALLLSRPRATGFIMRRVKAQGQ